MPYTLTSIEVVSGRMVRCRNAPGKKALKADENTYTFEQLPDERKKRYESLLEDFDKQVEAHICLLYTSDAADE